MMTDPTNIRKRKHSPPRKPCVQPLPVRRHLLACEIEAMVTSARGTSRHGLRNPLLIMLAYKHAMRVSELVNLRWTDIHFDTSTIFINRANNGRLSVQNLGPLASAVYTKLPWRRLAGPRTVSPAYWGLYPGQTGPGLEETIAVPDKARKMITPIGGTAYSNGEAVGN